MIGYLSRITPVILRAWLRADGRLVSRIRRRVHLRQIDLNLHLNQAMYAEIFELGRTDWFLRSGAWGHWRDRGIHPVVADQRLVYRRELKPLAVFEVDSRAVRIDGRLLVIESHLLVGDRVHTRNEARMLLIGPDGVLSADEAAQACTPFLTAPLPIQDWRVTGSSSSSSGTRTAS